MALVVGLAALAVFGIPVTENEFVNIWEYLDGLATDEQDRY